MNEVIQSIADGLVLSSLYAIVALGLTLTFGILGVVNFSHGQLITLAAYIGFSLIEGSLGFWVGLVLVIAALFVIGLGMEVLTFAPVSGVPINGLIVSVGWIAILGASIEIFWGPSHRTLESALSGSVEGPDFVLSANSVLVIVAALAVMAALTVLLRVTSLGRSMRATAQNAEAAALLGIRTRRIRAIAFGIGAGLAGMTGVLLANLFPISPGLGESYMVYAFVALVIGGAGSAVGAVVGSLVLGFVISFSQTFGSTVIAETVPFVVLIVVLLIWPTGLLKTDTEASL